jgi:hypothetical protein
MSKLASCSNVTAPGYVLAMFLTESRGTSPVNTSTSTSLCALCRSLERLHPSRSSYHTGVGRRKKEPEKRPDARSKRWHEPRTNHIDGQITV